MKARTKVRVNGKLVPGILRDVVEAVPIAKRRSGSGSLPHSLKMSCGHWMQIEASRPVPKKAHCKMCLFE